MREPTYKERFPEWRSAGGALKERKGDGREQVAGYRASVREKQRGEEPLKVWDLSNTFGALSAGLNRNKELILVASQRARKDLRGVPEEAKTLDGQTAVQTREPRDFYTNEQSARRKESAVGFRFQTGRDPAYLLSRLKKLTACRDLEVPETMLPFLSVERDKDELRYLRARAGRLAENRAERSDPLSEQGLRQRTEFVTAVVAEKERQQHMFRGKLQDLLDAARSKARRGWDFARPFAAGPGAPGHEDEDDDGIADGHGDDDEDVEMDWKAIYFILFSKMFSGMFRKGWFNKTDKQRTDGQ